MLFTQEYLVNVLIQYKCFKNDVFICQTTQSDSWSFNIHRYSIGITWMSGLVNLS